MSNVPDPKGEGMPEEGNTGKVVRGALQVVE